MEGLRLTFKYEKYYLILNGHDVSSFNWKVYSQVWQVALMLVYSLFPRYRLNQIVVLMNIR
jgi:hypothetical protein